MSSEEFDLIVVGGGPAGSTLASFVAMQNHKVLLLEREQFPRHQIGESLLPATVHGICKMLGLTEELKEAKFPIKHGATLRWGKSRDGKEFAPWSFTFGDSPVLKGEAATAYQVERAKFDHILLNNSKRKGVDVREKHTVTDVLSENGRVVGVRFTDENGNEKTAKARFVADASGNTTTLASKVGERTYSEFFRNLALFCYYEGGKRLPAPYSGNIITAAFDTGWFWYIPLTDTLTSLGVVISHERADEIKKQGYEQAMNSFIERCPIIKEYLEGATRITEGMYGQYRVRKDWSYACSRFWAPGAVLLGDSACFVDPVLSTGVHLATYSALLAARSINTLLRGDKYDETVLFNEYERHYREEYRKAYQFLVSFYDLQGSEDSYYWKARSVLTTEEQGNEAFLRIVAGVSTWGTTENFLQYTKDTSNVIKDSVTSYQDEKPAFSSEHGHVMHGMEPLFEKNDPKTPIMIGHDLHKSLYKIHVSAEKGEWAPEKPLFDDGFVPTPDGLHWRLPNS